MGALSDDAVRCLSVAYVGPKSRTESPRKTKIGTEVAHVTRDSDTTFKVKGQGHRGWGILWQYPAQLVTSAKEVMLLSVFVFVSLFVDRIMQKLN